MSAFHGFALHLQDCHNNKLAWKQTLFSTPSYSRSQGHSVFETLANLLLLVPKHSHHQWWASKELLGWGKDSQFLSNTVMCGISNVIRVLVWLLQIMFDWSVHVKIVKSRHFSPLPKCPPPRCSVTPAFDELCARCVGQLLLLLTSHSSLRNFLYTRIFMLMRPKYCSLTI